MQDFLSNLPLDVLMTICEERLSPRSRAMMAVCCNLFSKVNGERCARHASFQQTKGVMSALIVKRHARQVAVGGFVVAYVITPDFMTQQSYDITNDLHVFIIFAPLTVVSRAPRHPNPSWIDMTYSVDHVNVHFGWTDARSYRHPYNYSSTPSPYAHMLSATYGIPESVWALYVRECQAYHIPPERGVTR